MARLPGRLPQYPFGRTGIPDQINLEDNEKITFGDDQDVSLYWNGTDFIINRSGGNTTIFGWSGDDFHIYGGSATGQDIVIHANSTDTYPYLLVEGGGNISLAVDTGDSIVISEAGTAVFSFDRSGTTSRVFGSGTTGENLQLRANTADSYPLINLTGNSDIILNLPSGGNVVYKEEGTIYQTLGRGEFSYVTNKTSGNAIAVSWGTTTTTGNINGLIINVCDNITLGTNTGTTGIQLKVKAPDGTAKSYGIDFEGSDSNITAVFDFGTIGSTISNPGTLSVQVPVEYNGTVYYLYLYTSGS